MTYCNGIWGAASINNLKKIFLLQNRAVRVFNNADFLDHSSPLFKQSNILRIDDIYKMTCCLIAFAHTQTGMSNARFGRHFLYIVTFQNTRVNAYFIKKQNNGSLEAEIKSFCSSAA